MIRLRRQAAAVALSAAALVAFAQQGDPGTITVSDAASLVRAIAPGRTIVLKGGEYRLSTARGVTSPYASWSGAGGGELRLSGLRDLTIRGEGGVSIVSDSAGAAILGIYDSENVSFAGLSFRRDLADEEAAGASSLLARGVKGLSMDSCDFSGPALYAIEIHRSSGVSLRKSRVSGADSGAVYAEGAEGLALSGGTISDCQGSPLLYLGESGDFLIEGVGISGNWGDDLVELRSGEPSGDLSGDAGEPSVRFEDCEFSDNDFQYFAGSGPLPVVAGCSFRDNSFDEDWEARSVDPDVSEGGPADSGLAYSEPSGDGLRRYVHSSGLSFSYPARWALVEYGREARVGVFAPDDKSLVLFLVASRASSQASSPPAPKLFADSAQALAEKLKSGSGIVLSLEADGEPYTDNGLLSADYAGRATMKSGGRAAVRARFMDSGGLVCAMLAFADDQSALESDGDIDGIFSSVERGATGGR